MAINLIKEKLEKQIELLNELETAYSAELCKYVVKYEYNEGDRKVFSLYDREEDKLIKMDKHERIMSWFKIRNINHSKVKFIEPSGDDCGLLRHAGAWMGFLQPGHGHQRFIGVALQIPLHGCASQCGHLIAVPDVAQPHGMALSGGQPGRRVAWGRGVPNLFKRDALDHL